MNEKLQLFNQGRFDGVQLFHNTKFGNLRVIALDGDPWFVAADVCDALEISNPSDAIKRLDEDERARFNLGRQGEANVISFPGLLSLILGSRKPEAREYKRWVTHEVLPSVHKNGGYIAGQEQMDDAELMARALQVSQKVIESKQALIDQMKPKALFADSVSNSDTLILVRDLAHILRQTGVDIGQNRLFALLRKDGYIEKNRNEPTQRSLDLGVMQVVENAITKADGTTFVRRTPKITGKGQAYFVNRYGKDVA